MTAPFGESLESALKQQHQGGRFTTYSEVVVDPGFFCCISGLNVNKLPVSNIGVDKSKACTGVAVTVDYSHSWSPSSTINDWEVQWGDGNTSSGAWPGAGTVAHPLGGYALPGTYTITLITTDLLNVRGFATQQIVIVDCATYGTIEMYCSTDAAGVAGIWYTNDAGGNWADRAGEVLANVPVYDLKVNPFTIPVVFHDPIDNTEYVELWAATANGLYKCTDGARTGQSWKPITLPTVAGFVLESLDCVQISEIDPLTVYVLGHGNFALPQNDAPLILYVTRDGGLSWEYQQFGDGILPAIGGNFIDPDGRTYAMAVTPDDNLVIVMSPYWAAGGFIEFVQGFAIFPNNPDSVSGYLMDWLVISNFGTDAGPNDPWFGVVTDPIDSSVFWMFGRENRPAAPEYEVVLFWSQYIGNPADPEDYSWDWDSWEVGDASWDANEFVRPLLSSLYDPNDSICALNLDSEVWQTKDNFTSQAAIGITLPFSCQCGARHTWDESVIFIGRLDVGVGVDTDHLQISINNGVDWTERSGGLPAHCPITSIQILGGLLDYD